VVSANSTLQLYIQRIMLNLEETPPDHSRPKRVHPNLIDGEEWSWRKNYRVWEANRRVFLYPENYMLPELRDNKSQLFEAFEEKLASEDVNAESVRDAYIAYMRGFEQLSKLKITGAFHEKNTEEKRDVLHLFAVSAGEPKAHYYRRIEDFEYGITEEARSTNWGTWQEIDLKINSETLSPVMHQGRLHVFWTEVSSAPWTRLADSRQEFLGYKHRFRLYYTTRRIDGTWTEPQKIKLNRDPFHFGDGVVLDETFGGSVLYSDREHPEPIDDYTLSGFAWDRVLPEHMSASRSVLHIRGFDYRVNATVDFHEMALGDTLTSTLDDVRVPWIDPISALAALFLGAPIWFPSENILWSERVGSQRSLKKGPRPSWPYFTPYATGSLLLNKEVYEEMRRNRMGYNYMQNGWFPTEIDDRWKLDLTREIEKSFEGPELIRFDEGEPRLQVINGSPQHGLIDMDGALFALLDGLGEDGKYRLVRLNSSLTEDIARTLHNFGVDAMLDISAQEDLAEHALPFDIRSAEVDAAPAKVGEVDYGGAMGVYLEEIYLHMPLTIARVLNAQGDFAAAREWYQKVFDPMTSDEITDFPPGLTAAEIEHRKLDRVWRFRKFRGREVESLRDMLEDPAALDTYRNDPFNPHAIARLRTSTTQKYVLLAFVDNLLDEADALFATDLREQINEATLLYVLALDILGPRPNKLGDCGERIGEGLSFEEVEARVNSGNEMLLEIETMIINRGRRFVGAVAAEELRIREATARGLRVAGAEIRRDAERLVEGLALETRHEVEGFFHDGAIGERVGLDRGVSSDDLALAGALSPMMPMAAVGPYGASMDRTSHSAKMRRRGTGVGSVASVGEGGAFKGGTAGTGLAVSEKVRLVGQYAAREPLGIGGAGGRFTFVPSFGMSLIRSVDPVFCIPENDSLKGYWDRVEDRLFKIRNCMNIDGVRRPLALFAPRIDPMMLVRARAAGLAIDDILGAGAGELPPFRFRFLLERARSAVGMAKGMGEAMKSALIAKDAEELAQLRNAHSANILTLGRELKKLEIEMAEHGIEELAARKAMVEARKTYYTDLISKGDLSEESTEKNSKIAATVLKGIATGLELTAGIINLIPDAGPINPELGGGKKSAKVVKTIGTGFKLGADIATLVGVIAGNNAKKKRRYEGWNHAKSQAEYELATFPPREEAAATRLRIALDSLALQETQMEQQDEIIEFYEDKFTNMALYSHLASNLQRLYRQAFNIALTYARLAESAYRFETSEDSFVIGASHWDANRAGLLAADRLMLDLATLEQRWVEGSKRKMEVNQTFSLAQLDPAALMRLRETGGANFSIPEHAASLFYPGLYKMRIKAVRLTIPCVAGPYTNISATLALTESAIRGTTDLAVDPVTAPRARDAMIATSTAQSDAGVFDLNFKDERYLPFEGAGVISSWRLDLPKTFRPFSYDTISDVLVNISYTADYDAGLRTAMEDEAGALDAALVSVFAEVPQTRIISLRQDVSAAYQRLVSAPPGTAVDFDLTETMFPLFLRGKTLSVERTTMLIRTAEGISPAGVAFSLNGRAASAFAGDADFGDLPATTVANAFAGGLIGSQSLSVTNAADLAPDDGPSALSHDKIKDVLIAIDYTVAGAGA
ncbi:MAG: neuraminidase-like domain-containing protein, partial [Rubricella sp.]